MEELETPLVEVDEAYLKSYSDAIIYELMRPKEWDFDFTLLLNNEWERID